MLDLLVKSKKYSQVETMLMDLLQDPNFSAYHHGLISLRISILEKTNKKDVALDIAKTLDGKTLHDIKQLAQLKLDLGCYSEAIDDFDKIEGKFSSPKDIASHLLCLAQTRPLDIDKLLDQVKLHCPSLDLSQDVPVLPAKLSKGIVSKKVHRKKKKKLSKNYKPNVLPDPNRWLPKVARNQLKDEPSGFQGASNVAGEGMGSTGSAKIPGAPKSPKSDVVPKTAKESLTKDQLTAKLSAAAAAKKKGKKRR
jgi:SRP72 RNA-binding domain